MVPDVDEATRMFRETLREKGITDVEITHKTDVVRSTDTFTIKKRIGSQVIGTQVAISDFAHKTDEEVIKELRLNAEIAADELHEELSTRLSWTDGEMMVGLYDGGWAKCLCCQTEVEFPLNRLAPAFSADAEMSTPQPLPKEKEHLLGGLSDHHEVLARLYLIAEVRRSCEVSCQLSNKYLQQ